MLSASIGVLLVLFVWSEWPGFAAATLAALAVAALRLRNGVRAPQDDPGRTHRHWS